MSYELELTHLTRQVIGADRSWRVVSYDHDLVRAIPNQLEEVLPAIGSSSKAPGSAWLTLDFWVDHRPRPRLGVFWSSNAVRHREARNRVLKALVETEETGFEYKGTKRPWSEIDEPIFSGRTVSNSSWWPAGGDPDIHEARNVVRDQLEVWGRRLPRIVETLRSAMSIVAGGVGPVGGPNEPSGDRQTIHDLSKNKTVASTPRTDLPPQRLSTTQPESKIKLTPPLPAWVREDTFQPHYTNIHELLKHPRLTPEQRAENGRRLYATETIGGFNDWNAPVLLLAKDAGPMQTFRRLIEEGDGVHCQERPCTQPWRHAVPPEQGSPTNENLRNLAPILPGTKLYGSVMAGLLRNDGEQSGPLPNFEDEALQAYLRRILEEIVFPGMKNLEVIICLGNEACKVVGTVIGSAEFTRDFRALRDAAKPIEFNGKQVFAGYHTSPQVMNNRRMAENARRVWFAARRVLER